MKKLLSIALASLTISFATQNLPNKTVMRVYYGDMQQHSFQIETLQALKTNIVAQNFDQVSSIASTNPEIAALITYSVNNTLVKCLSNHRDTMREILGTILVKKSTGAYGLATENLDKAIDYIRATPHQDLKDQAFEGILGSVKSKLHLLGVNTETEEAGDEWGSVSELSLESKMTPVILDSTNTSSTFQKTRKALREKLNEHQAQTVNAIGLSFKKLKQENNDLIQNFEMHALQNSASLIESQEKRFARRKIKNEQNGLSGPKASNTELSSRLRAFNQQLIEWKQEQRIHISKITTESLNNCMLQNCRLLKLLKNQYEDLNNRIENRQQKRTKIF